MAHVVTVERLRRRSEFRAAARGARVSGSAFVLQALRRPDEDPPRVGFTVSKQVGNAVERNRVRRRLREVVRSTAAGTAGAGDAMRPGHDYVLVGRRAALGIPFGEIMRELDAALGRIHSAERGGTGGPRRGPPHEADPAGPPSRPQAPRRGPSASRPSQHQPLRRSREDRQEHRQEHCKSME